MAAAFRLPSPGFGNQCNKVRRKEGSGQGWLVKTQVFLFKTDKLTQVRTLRHPETSTLSFVSAITLCIRSDCFSLTARAPESSLRLSLNCRSTAAFIRSPRQLLQSDTGDPHFALDPLTYRCLLIFLPLQTSLNHAPLATMMSLGIRPSCIQQTWPSQHRHLCERSACMLNVFAWASTSGFGTRSFQVMPRILLRQCRWKELSLRSCQVYIVQVSLP